MEMVQVAGSKGTVLAVNDDGSITVRVPSADVTAFSEDGSSFPEGSEVEVNTNYARVEEVDGEDTIITLPASELVMADGADSEEPAADTEEDMAADEPVEDADASGDDDEDDEDDENKEDESDTDSDEDEELMRLAAIETALAALISDTLGVEIKPIEGLSREARIKNIERAIVEIAAAAA